MTDKVEEMTVAGVVPVAAALAKGIPSGKMPCGTPYFNCDDDIFYTLHLRKREKGQWYDKYYVNSDVAEFARKNKNQAFYLKHNELGFFRKVK